MAGTNQACTSVKNVDVKLHQLGQPCPYVIWADWLIQRQSAIAHSEGYAIDDVG